MTRSHIGSNLGPRNKSAPPNSGFGCIGHVSPDPKASAAALVIMDLVFGKSAIVWLILQTPSRQDTGPRDLLDKGSMTTYLTLFTVYVKPVIFAAISCNLVFSTIERRHFAGSNL